MRVGWNIMLMFFFQMYKLSVIFFSSFLFILKHSSALGLFDGACSCLMARAGREATGLSALFRNIEAVQLIFFSFLFFTCNYLRNLRCNCCLYTFKMQNNASPCVFHREPSSQSAAQLRAPAAREPLGERHVYTTRCFLNDGADEQRLPPPGLLCFFGISGGFHLAFPSLTGIFSMHAL